MIIDYRKVATVALLTVTVTRFFIEIYGTMTLICAGIIQMVG